MKIVTVLPMDKVNDFRVCYERKQSINDLCKTLAYNNGLFNEKESIFYNRLINENIECLKMMEKFWEECKSKYNIELKQGEELYIDFASNELAIREIK